MQFNSYLFWEQDYLNHEAEFLSYIKYVPLDKINQNVWSLKLAEQLLLVGSSIDSFFKCAKASLRKSLIDDRLFYSRRGICYTYEEFQEESYLYNNLLKNESNMGLFRKIFENYYNLSNKTVYILINRTELCPFKEWAYEKSPEWWKNYTDIKHDKYKNRRKATLKTILNALTALFLLNIFHFENRRYLVDIEVIKSNIHLPNYSAFFNGTNNDSLNPIIAKTKLFGYIFNTDSHWNSHPWTILDPGNVYRL